MVANDEKDDEEAATLVLSRSSLPKPTKPEPAPESGVVITPPSNPPESFVVERPLIADSKPINPDNKKPTFWGRFFRDLERFLGIFWGSPTRLSDHLPSVPLRRAREMTLISPGASANDEQAENMLLALLRTRPEYQRAAIEVARWALDTRRDGQIAYADFIVHFALSRMRPDENGRISAIRLRDTLPFMPYQAEILPALEWLEKKKAVVLILEKNDKDPMAALMREGLQYIELRAPV